MKASCTDGWLEGVNKTKLKKVNVDPTYCYDKDIMVTVTAVAIFRTFITIVGTESKTEPNSALSNAVKRHLICNVFST